MADIINGTQSDWLAVDHIVGLPTDFSGRHQIPAGAINAPGRRIQVARR